MALMSAFAVSDEEAPMEPVEPDDPELLVWAKTGADRPRHSAVEMAGQELENGVNPNARELATRIVKSRTAEIEMMLGMLTG